MRLYKYPRTNHIEGSRFQPGDDELENVPFSRIRERTLVIEEKMDGANAALSFSSDGALLLQSRGHFLTGGPRERHFDLFKSWAASHAGALWPVLGARYVVYGEWLYAKHTIFYDQLPHFFLEFDVLDSESGHFLSTELRRALLAGLPLAPVRVLWTGAMHDVAQLAALVGPSSCISSRKLDRLRQSCAMQGLDAAHCERDTDTSGEMEGLYIKVEEGGLVTERYKFIRAGFLTTVLQADDHWLDRPIVPNLLREGVDLFAPSLP